VAEIRFIGFDESGMGGEGIFVVGERYEGGFGRSFYLRAKNVLQRGVCSA